MPDSKATNDESYEDVLGLTTEIVSAYVSNNAMAAADIPALIKSVYGTLSNLEKDETAALTELTPAVPVKKSITPEFIVCLEDGKKLKMLKRYLRSQYGMTPEDYRARWGLPPDYPMVAPNYAAQRSKLAKQIGLGRVSAAPVTRGRRKK
ncbi:MAG: transcriptional regulator [Rhizobiales bacterium]|nr:transcriptional regulator [Hyphomicrobiales bacterium]